MARYKHPKVVETKLGQEKSDGIMNYEQNTIYLDIRLKGVNKIDSYLHERLHALYPDWEEKQVARTASVLADFLWIHHFRFVDNLK